MNPLFNRALTAYPPGSVYKMVTSIAAVDLGGFDPGYIIEDKGLYTYYDSFQPKCHIWSLANPRTHGKINLMQAIAYSCNYYFYEVGRLTYNSYMEKTGENPFDIVAKALGLGEHTGIELFEYTGQRANAETKKANYAGDESGWYGADVLQAVIGQSLNRFTPMATATQKAAATTPHSVGVKAPDMMPAIRTAGPSTAGMAYQVACKRSFHVHLRDLGALMPRNLMEM